MLKLKKKSFFFSFLSNHLYYYPTPANLNFFWSFGFLASFFLIIQVISGLIISMFYTPHILFAFLSVENIMRNIEFGWLLRYIHSNGASFFFFFVYTHLFRGLYYKVYKEPRVLVWLSGIIILILIITIAFLGYVLPWGQMSFWGATVISSLTTTLPLIGSKLVFWLWGGFSVANPTLNKFYTLHFFLPFILIVFVCIHLLVLHKNSSSNPLFNLTQTKIRFFPFFLIKDFWILSFFLICFIFIIFFMSNILGHSDNYIPGNPLITPIHIVPEWYFLPFYAILRGIPSKRGGAFIMFLSLFSFILLAFINNLNTKYNFEKNIICYSDFFFFWIFFFNFIFLGWLGQNSTEYPYTLYTNISIFTYFIIIFCVFPINPLYISKKGALTSKNYKFIKRNWELTPVSKNIFFDFFFEKHFFFFKFYNNLVFLSTDNYYKLFDFELIYSLNFSFFYKNLLLKNLKNILYKKNINNQKSLNFYLAIPINYLESLFIYNLSFFLITFFYKNINIINSIKLEKSFSPIDFLYFSKIKEKSNNLTLIYPNYINLLLKEKYLNTFLFTFSSFFFFTKTLNFSNKIKQVQNLFILNIVLKKKIIKYINVNFRYFFRIDNYLNIINNYYFFYTKFILNYYYFFSNNILLKKNNNNLYGFFNKNIKLKKKTFFFNFYNYINSDNLGFSFINQGKLIKISTIFLIIYFNCLNIKNINFNILPNLELKEFQLKFKQFNLLLINYKTPIFLSLNNLIINLIKNSNFFFFFEKNIYQIK